MDKNLERIAGWALTASAVLLLVCFFIDWEVTGYFVLASAVWITLINLLSRVCDGP
jgi:hypothetical protein